jgi:arylsulfatase A-like enzyme
MILRFCISALFPLGLFLAKIDAAPRTNILILLADDLGQRDLVCYHQGSFYETPNIDRLAAQGVRFSNGYSANPVCSPTRYALVTGKWPTRTGLTNFLPGNRTERFQGAPLTLQLPTSEITLAEALKPAGYHSVFVGKWHLGANESDWPEHHGFDENIAGCSAGHPKSWFSPYQNPRLKDGPTGEFLTERLADETIAAMKRAKESGKPFFIYHAFYQVHIPLEAPADLVAKYEAKAKRLGLQAIFKPEEQIQISANSAREVRQNQTLPVYAAMVESMDHATGKILAALDALGLADNTLVIFTSDNGGLSTAEGAPTSNLPFRAGKGWLYDGGIREPFIVRWPGVAVPGMVETTPVTTLDIFPTALDAAGVKTNAGDGINLRPLLRGEKLAPRDLYWHYPHYSNQGGFPGGAIRSGDWKLIERFEDGAVSLYDIKKDPGEKTDLSTEESQRTREMREKLHAWYRETGAKFLRPLKQGPAAWSPYKIDPGP